MTCVDVDLALRDLHTLGMWGFKKKRAGEGAHRMRGMGAKL
jgi:hypothetical protein